jgi:Zn-dependent M28 family amino/carboxypeptidase
MIRMPGTSWSGALPPPTPRHAETAARLKRDVEKLAGEIGERNLYKATRLAMAAEYIESRFKEAGYSPARQEFETRMGPCRNIEVALPGTARPGEIIVVGAHYDSVFGCPAANDNGTGTAALLALADAFEGTAHARTIRFVAFPNEEPPFWGTAEMGSRVYAKRCRERGENIVAMVSLETIGFYSDKDGSQKYPFPMGLFYPSRGDFVAFVGNLGSRSLVRGMIDSFRVHAQFPSQGAALPGWLPGVGWSDHQSFWLEGYPGVMVTDTAPFRYPHYHSTEDTPDKVDYEKCARVVVGLQDVLAGMLSTP